MFIFFDSLLTKNKYFTGIHIKGKQKYQLHKQTKVHKTLKITHKNIKKISKHKTCCVSISIRGTTNDGYQQLGARTVVGLRGETTPSAPCFTLPSSRFTIHDSRSFFLLTKNIGILIKLL